MSAFDAAIQGLGRAIASFHPSSMPRLSRAHYRRELAAWTALPLALGAVEGGVVGVIAKNAFAGAVSVGTLNMTVGILVAAQAFANIVSFAWVALSHGRSKIRMLTMLQLGTVLMVGLIALAPFNAWGLALLVVGVVGARICWAGVSVLRPTVWHANYPRKVRATLAGKLATVQSIVMALIAYAIGAAVEFDPHAIRIIYPVAALAGGAGVLIYSGMRMRGHRALINAERNGDLDDAARSFNPLRWRDILRNDSKYRAYQTCMYIFGMGNLMVTAPLVIMLKDRFHLGEGVQTLIVTAIPFILMPLSIAVWSRMLDRMHIIHYRAIQSWSFVSAIAVILIATTTSQAWLLFGSAVLMGIAYGGGVLGWNLGHHDFAPPERVSQYMGVHVTLTGLRGMVGPLLGVSAYQALEWSHAGAGAWVMALALAMSVTGAVGFVSLARKTPRITV